MEPARMDYYQPADAPVAWNWCASRGEGAVTGVAELTVTISNDAPTDGLPAYITGAASGVSPRLGQCVRQRVLASRILPVVC